MQDSHTFPSVYLFIFMLAFFAVSIIKLKPRCIKLAAITGTTVKRIQNTESRNCATTPRGRAGMMHLSHRAWFSLSKEGTNGIVMHEKAGLASYTNQQTPKKRRNGTYGPSGHVRSQKREREGRKLGHGDMKWHPVPIVFVHNFPSYPSRVIFCSSWAHDRNAGCLFTPAPSVF